MRWVVFTAKEVGIATEEAMCKVPQNDGLRHGIKEARDAHG